MKIELKNTDFKYLYKFLENNVLKADGFWENQDKINSIIMELKPQYEKAFLKYKDEKQKFNVGDKVEFGRPNEKTNGKIIKVSRLANGKYKYLVQYKYQSDIDEDTGEEIFDNGKTYLTEKNIRKI